MNMIRLVIVDDHPLVREGLKKILSKKSSEITITGEASGREELFQILEQEEPDIVVLDIELPEQNGLEILKEVRQKHPDVAVLMLSMYPADRFAVRSFKAGAAGYLTKTGITDELEKAIRMIVHEKKKYISPSVAEVLAEQIDDHAGQPPHARLSDREYQVMCMIAEGYKISDIAKALSLGVRTVHTYRTRMMEKLNLKSNVEIAHYAIKNNLIDQHT